MLLQCMFCTYLYFFFRTTGMFWTYLCLFTAIRTTGMERSAERIQRRARARRHLTFCITMIFWRYSDFVSGGYFEDIQILYQEDILKIFSFWIRIIFLYEMSAEIHSAFMLMTLRWYRKVQFSLPYGFSWWPKKLVRKRDKKIKDS